MDASEAFQAFKEVWAQARIDPSRTSEAGRLLSIAVQAAGKTSKDLERAGFVDRTSVSRWLRGQTVPHQAQLIALEHFLVPQSADHRSPAISLLDWRYRPVITLLLEEESAGQKLSEDQLIEALDLAAKSKKTITPAMIRTFLGLDDSEA